MRAGEVQSKDEEAEEQDDEEEDEEEFGHGERWARAEPSGAGIEDRGPRSSEPQRMETRRGPGRLCSHIFQRSSAGRREKRC